MDFHGKFYSPLARTLTYRMSNHKGPHSSIMNRMDLYLKCEQSKNYVRFNVNVVIFPNILGCNSPQSHYQSK